MRVNMQEHLRWFNKKTCVVTVKNVACINKYKIYAIVFASTQLRIGRLRKYPIDPKARALQYTSSVFGIA